MREYIQSKLEELADVQTSAEIPDEVIESGITYFSFSLNENFVDADFNNEFTNEVNITGYVKRSANTSENTLNIVDTATKDIISKLKELNIRCSYQDVTALDNLKKIRITGTGKYNEINDKLV